MSTFSDIEARVEKASAGFKLSTESIIQQGFNIFRKAPGPLIIYSLIVALVMSNPLSGILLGGPALLGFYIAAWKIRQGRNPVREDFLKSFELFFPLLILQLMISVIVALGLVMLVIPGIYLAVSYVFAHFFVGFYHLAPGDALRFSRRTVSGNFGQIFLLCLILLGINTLGFMAFGIGLLLSMPLSACIMLAAFDDIIGLPKL